MKSFEELYKELEKEDKLKELWEQARRESKKTNKIAWSICLSLDAIILIVAGKRILGSISLGLPFMIGLMTVLIPILMLNLIIFICVSAIFNKSGSKYTNEFKESVIKKLINNFYTNIEYFPKKQMPQRIYKEPKCYEWYDNYYSDDYIEAKIDNNYFIEMAEIVTEKEIQEKDKDGNTRIKKITLFHGLFERITIDKSIETELKIACDGSYKFDKKRLKMDSRRI